MKYLTMLSWAITALGAVTIMVAALIGMAPLWLLIGILMLITGVVKIVMLQIWTRIARLGTDEHDPINAL
jgi:predicted signal transduction protein with EAL and GGDEF domain